VTVSFLVRSDHSRVQTTEQIELFYRHFDFFDVFWTAMRWLNYQHLLYFWTVAREGGVTRASEVLRLSQPTISGQIRELERSLGHRLFQKSGRNLVLTDVGQLVYRYAEDIFALGQELGDSLRGTQRGRSLKVFVGVADSLPKLIVYRLLEPALRMAEPVHLVCLEGRPEELLTQLALHRLDIALLDMPAPPTVNVRAFSHLLGESSLTVFGTPALARTSKKEFPRSLNGAPFLLPAENSVLRRNLELWFDANDIHPQPRGEFADLALMKVFGQAGAGLFVAPTATEKEVCRQYHVRAIGVLPKLREQFYAVSVERKLKHPAVVAISEAARRELFAEPR
jgi:LysR family transcriptional activator of nhaA